MTLVKRGHTWHYDFRYKNRRHQGTTEQTDRDDAQLVDDQVKQRLRRESYGLISAHPEAAPRISEFAFTYLQEQRRRLTRPDVLERTLRMVLGFWGTKPKKDPLKGAPYHNLRLSD